MQRLLIFLLFMAAGTAAVILLTTGRRPPAQTADPVNLPVNVLALGGVILRQHEPSGLKLVLQAGSAVVDERSNLLELEAVRFLIFEQGGRTPPMLSGRAGRARVEQEQGTILLSEQVVLLENSGMEMRSETLVYREKTNQITAPGEVTIKTAQTTHTGHELVYDLGTRTLTLVDPRITQ